MICLLTANIVSNFVAAKADEIETQNARESILYFMVYCLFDDEHKD
jgi:hypothetical protein